MNKVQDVTFPPPAPHEILITMVQGGLVSRLVYLAAELGLADHLGSGARSAGELAGPLGVHAPSLHRFMRTLASLGILTQSDDGQRFGLTPLGAALRNDAPGSARSTLRLYGGNLLWSAFTHLRHSLETGQNSVEKACGMPLFEYLSKHPDEASLFSEAMLGFHGSEPPAVAEAYDFSRFGTVVDVGGASGNMLAAILGRHAGPRGILFDLPHVVGNAPALLERQGIASRVTIESGDFFKKISTGGDAYILSHIIHDWTEDQCLTILANCREAMKPDSRLLIVEMVLPEGDSPHPGKMFDMGMLAVTGGRERTETEYAALLSSAGFRLTHVTPTRSAVSIVEAVLA